MKKIFIYTNEIFNSELLVAVEANENDLIKWAGKNGTKDLKEILKTKENINLIEEEIKKNSGVMFCFEKDNKFFFLMWLKTWRNNWEDLDTLNHEIVHYRQFIFEKKNINNEIEFEAYFQESVYRELRRKLNKLLK